MSGLVFGVFLMRTIAWCIEMDIKIVRFVIKVIRSVMDQRNPNSLQSDDQN